MPRERLECVLLKLHLHQGNFHRELQLHKGPRHRLSVQRRFSTVTSAGRTVRRCTRRQEQTLKKGEVNDQLKAQCDDVEHERLESFTADSQANLEVDEMAKVEPHTASETVEPRKSTRKRKFTTKMLELKEQEAFQRESRFIKLYERWTDQVRASILRTSVLNRT
ncbi:hypothetical protein SRHO_G00032360 [Serrasalmus rhombeus]